MFFFLHSLSEINLYLKKFYFLEFHFLNHFSQDRFSSFNDTVYTSRDIEYKCYSGELETNIRPVTAWYFVHWIINGPCCYAEFTVYILSLCKRKGVGARENNERDINDSRDTNGPEENNPSLLAAQLSSFEITVLA